MVHNIHQCDNPNLNTDEPIYPNYGKTSLIQTNWESRLSSIVKVWIKLNTRKVTYTVPIIDRF